MHAANLAAPTTPAAPTVAWLFGQPVLDVPADLFIPPDALQVVLQSFEGPLDLLLYLIRKQNIDVLDIPMRKITEQYLAYIAQMDVRELDLTAEYLLMAAVLIEIKSRLLLPQPPAANEEEADPRAELVRRLLAYEQMKLAALALDALPRAGRDFAWAWLPLEISATATPPQVQVADLSRVTHDPLLANLRYTLRRRHGFSRDTHAKMRVPCVYSTENITPPPNNNACAADAAPQGLSCAGYGAAMVVTASFGLRCAQIGLEALCTPPA